jgi:hypothetical protein
MLISDALAARNVEVQHIVSQRGRTAVQLHRLTPFARIDAAAGGEGAPAVRYPGLV